MPVRVEVAQRFPVPVDAGFGYITDPGNWPDYWPRLVRIDPGSRWREPGDHALLALRMLGRDVELDMTLSHIEPCRVVEYTSAQRGLPAARHRRVFEAVGAGEFDYRIEVEYAPRAGWRGLFDRTLVRRAVTRTAHATMVNLERRLRDAGAAAPRGSPE